MVKASTNELIVRLMGTISGRITWLFYLTSGLPADEAFHDHVLLRDAIASGNERVAESVAYAQSSGTGSRRSRRCGISSGVSGDVAALLPVNLLAANLGIS